MIRVLIADDQALVRQGLAALLKLEADIEVVAQASNGIEAHQLVLEMRPDVVLMDLRMPKGDGVTATRSIRNDFPKAKVLVLTTFDDDQSIAAAIDAGASGYLLKDVESEKLSETIRSVSCGNTQFDIAEGISERTHLSEEAGATQSAEPLSAREVEVVELIARGRSNKEIGQQLFLSEGTVKNHVTKILSTLNLRDRTQIAIWSHNNQRKK